MGELLAAAGDEHADDLAFLVHQTYFHDALAAAEHFSGDALHEGGAAEAGAPREVSGAQEEHRATAQPLCPVEPVHRKVSPAITVPESGHACPRPR